jgi:site-specific recombinase XerD
VVIKVLKSLVVGPLEPYAAGFAAELDRQGYTRWVAEKQVSLAAHLSRWLAASGAGPADLTTDLAERYALARREAGYAGYLSVHALEPLLGYLRGLGAVPAAQRPEPTPAQGLLGRFQAYLVSERGITPATAESYACFARPFAETRLAPGGPGLGGLTAADVTAFVVASCPGMPKGSAKMTVSSLRSLLVWLHVDGVLSQPLAWAVPSVAAWRLARLPQPLEPAQVQAMLDSCDRGTANGRRDLAMLTLLARLGLRAGEVAGLRLEDIDWRAGELTVCGKGRRSERLPLPADVGGPIAAYLRDGRPRPPDGERQVFLRVKAPHRPLTGGGVTQAVASAGRRAGLETTVHAHRLRHSAATSMLRAGAGLPEIGQVLRHRRLMSTAIYAKTDVTALRGLARPWPGGAA